MCILGFRSGLFYCSVDPGTVLWIVVCQCVSKGSILFIYLFVDPVITVWNLCSSMDPGIPVSNPIFQYGCWNSCEESVTPMEMVK